MTVSEKKKVPCHISTQKMLQPSSYHIEVAWWWALKELRAETGCLLSRHQPWYHPARVHSGETHDGKNAGYWPQIAAAAAAAAKSPQSCLTPRDPRDGSPPGSPVPGILQARTLEWVAISFSNAWKWKVKVKLFSRVRLPVTPWTAAHQAPPSMGFSRQEYWSGVPLPSPR